MSIIRFRPIMKYIFISCFYDGVDVNIYLYKFGQTQDSRLGTNSEFLTLLDGGSRIY